MPTTSRRKATKKNEETTMADNPFAADAAPAAIDPTLIKAAPADFKRPGNPGAGRPKLPSLFEPVLRDYLNADWQFYPHDGSVVLDAKGKPTKESFKASNASAIVRDLRKARTSLGLGLDIVVDEANVAFRVRDARPNVGRKAASAE